MKRINRYGRAYREYQEFMIDILNMMCRVYAAELHQNFGFGAERCERLQAAVIKTCHASIERYEDYNMEALDGWCRDFGFDATVALDEDRAVRFVGGVIPPKKGDK